MFYTTGGATTAWPCLADVLTHPAGRRGRALTSRAAWQRLTATLAPAARAQADVWLLEWHWLHAAAPCWLPAWPADARLRRRYLTACAQMRRLPPRRAWAWLAGMAQACATPAHTAWATLWRDFITGAATLARTAPFCLLAGTPMAAVRPGPLIDWCGAAVRAYFRNGWAQVQRNGRETSSRIEERWWRRVRTAFPAQTPQRHVPLPDCGMHLDVYWRAPQVALEIQGQPHWQSCAYYGGAPAFARRQERDARKRALCNALGITLLEVTPDTPVQPVLQRLAALLAE